MRKLLLFIFALSLTGCSDAKPKKSGGDYLPQEGDVLFQSLPSSPLIDAIEGSTKSPFSHCGILHNKGGEWVVIEAIGPVKETPFGAWLTQGRGARYAAFRLKETYQDKVPKFIAAAKRFAGLPYDIHYSLNDEAIYCSELIYKAFLKTTGEKMGQLCKLGELDWGPHVKVIKEIEGGNVPVEREMITPRHLSEATQLDAVFSNIAPDKKK